MPSTANPTQPGIGNLPGAFGQVATQDEIWDQTTHAQQGGGGGGAPSGPAGGDLGGTYPNPAVQKINGVAVTGTPSTGYVLTATGPATATWQVAGTGGPPSGPASNDLSGTYPGPTVSRVNGVAVTGTPASGYVLTASSPTAASWQLPAAPPPPATTVIGPDAFGAPAAVGSSLSYARQDHDHGLPANPSPNPATTVSGPPAYGSAPVVGASLLYSRGDHAHGLPAQLTAAGTVVGPDAFGSPAAVGSMTSYAREDHHHGNPANPAPNPATTVTGPDAFGAPSAVGASLLYARQDHDHGLPANPSPAVATSVVGPDAFGTPSAVGTSLAYARQDHDHGLPSSPAPGPATTVTGPPAYSSAPVVGTGTLYARNDHAHGLPGAYFPPQAPPPSGTNTFTDAAGVVWVSRGGSAWKLAREALQCRVNRVAAWTIGTATVAISFDTMVKDDYAIWNGNTNFVVPIAGWYSLNMLLSGLLASVFQLATSAYRGGGATRIGYITSVSPSTGGWVGTVLSALAYLNAAEVITFNAASTVAGVQGGTTELCAAGISFVGSG